MRRLFLALLALLGLAATAAAAPRDWSKTVRQTPAGAFVVGNPAAKVKLVEYLSYTCPHCGEFMTESAATRAQMIRSGTLSVETRHAVREKLDLAAALVARCGGSAGFPRLNELIFARQRDWYFRGSDWIAANDGRLSLYPEAARLRAYADNAGLSALAQANGVPAAQLDRCFADDAALRQLAAMAADAWGRINGTPTFEINGKQVSNATWATLQPQLRAAGAR